MPSVEELKDKVNTKTLNFVLLTVVTFGVYPLLWMYRNNSMIESTIKTKITDNSYIVWIAVCLGVSGAFSESALTSFGDDAIIMFALSMIFSMTSAILYIVWAFKARTAIQNYALNTYKIDLKMNGFLTFFCTIYYVNYCINKLAESRSPELSGDSVAFAKG